MLNTRKINYLTVWNDDSVYVTRHRCIFGCTMTHHIKIDVNCPIRTRLPLSELDVQMSQPEAMKILIARAKWLRTYKGTPWRQAMSQAGREYREWKTRYRN